MKKTTMEPLVALNTNPCNMCMPLGFVLAFYGISGCMTLLHGSQGCSTYIRRHMATHFNEPVDIASTSLTEHGTVYGGEENLQKGLCNLIELYHPEVIGIGTTCLAETIGEDLVRMIHNFREQFPEHNNVKIVTVSTPGYGGTQFEGYMQAMYEIVNQLAVTTTKHEKINVFVSPSSPKDLRNLKEAFLQFGLDAVFLPDYSENLDGGYQKKYQRLPEAGISVSEIEAMAGARCSIELGNTEIEQTPGKLLEEKFGIKNYKLNLPCGLRDTDAFYKLLSKLSGRDIPEKIQKERSRYLDAMIDSHKYNGQVRIAIFGEPDFVHASLRLCEENGIYISLLATGSLKKNWKEKIEEELEKEVEKDWYSKDSLIEDTDFVEIEKKVIEQKSNVLLGNSDARRIEERLGLPLVRRGFPIHDRMGGQRLTMLLYEGSQALLDEITNARLSQNETSFRKELFKEYYKPLVEGSEMEKTEQITEIETSEKIVSSAVKTIEERTLSHPCYTGCGAKSARIHLPIAPACNIQCNYCVRKFDCPNESRPGVTTAVLTPAEAVERYKLAKEKIKNLSVVGIAGPGDALANFEETSATLREIRTFDPDVTFCLSTNGLLLPQYAEELVELGVTHVTVTVNAVDIHIGAKIYHHIHYSGVRFTGESAAAILLANQLAGLRILVSKGILCKVNIVMIKGVNDTHIPEIVAEMKKIGIFMTNIMPMISVKGSEFESLESVTKKEVDVIRKECEPTLKQMYHCKQCRADAVGTLDQDLSLEYAKSTCKKEEIVEKDYKFAVASTNGIWVDQHFGQSTEFYIYEYHNGEASLLETRNVEKYCREDSDGAHESRMNQLVKVIGDCNALLALRIGDSPKKLMQDKGIKVIATYDVIKDAVKKAAIGM